MAPIYLPISLFVVVAVGPHKHFPTPIFRSTHIKYTNARARFTGEIHDDDWKKSISILCTNFAFLNPFSTFCGYTFNSLFYPNFIYRVNHKRHKDIKWEI